MGGGVGAVARWTVSAAVLHYTVDWKFPLSTFLVNIIGCLAAGVLGGLVIKHDMFGPEARLFLFTGLLGGFTTFSAFGLETVYLLRRQEFAVAVGYVLSSMLCGVAGLWLALAMVRDRT
jgi:CrcB protein